ncbi:calpain family cysteine protease [Murinocardiopsis flavida]|uniref:Calpain family cysteine protease n=1 Tax=Murinocardiopsis flavida TaxID=645275 RepID=A0A2P8DFD3_9ACTN|nr:C2 family cysteine protease [Murinocardiopsis flavida]PSK95922.1 calpain family cysteine protease [Murinocardiopsis flavida]
MPRSSRPHAPRRPAARLRSDIGAGIAEYSAVVILVGVLAAGLTAAVLNTSFTASVTAAVCELTGGDCEEPAPEPDDGGGDRDEVYGKPDKPDSGSGGGSPNQPPAPGRPDDEAFESAEDDIEAIKEYLNDDSDWYNPGSWGKPTAPEEIMKDMTAEELAALYHSLSADEIRELLDQDGVREITLRKLDIDNLRRLHQIAPDKIEPSFADIEDDVKKKSPEHRSNDLAYGEVPGGRLYPEKGEISSDDIEQGGLGDCWWLSGFGAVADTDPEIIRDMIKPNSNGTYTVEFPDGESVTVTPDLVMGEDGSAEFADPGSDAVMWPAILEKAYAEKEGSFGEIEGGFPSDAMETITGHDSEEHDPGDVSESQINEWATGDPKTAVSVTTKPEDDADGERYKDDTLVPGHAYIVKGAKDGRVTLYNPWGHEVSVTMDEFQSHLQSVDTNSLGKD